MPRISIAVPNMTGKEAEYAADAVASGSPRMGAYVKLFEEMVAKACGAEWCVATTTGTAALHLAMVMAGFTGKQLSAPDWTFVAAGNVMAQIGATAVYRDDDLDHDGAWYEEIGTAWPTVVDAAPAVGAFGDQLDIGSMACLSFNGNKTITTGQGGAIVGNNGPLLTALRYQMVPREGGQFNYAMANINAAVGVAQMERLDEFLAKKQAIWMRYLDAGIDVLDVGESRWMSLSPLYPDKIGRFRHAGIEVKRFWKRAGGHTPPIFCLPCSTNLTEKDQDEVIKVLT